MAICLACFQEVQRSGKCTPWEKLDAQTNKNLGSFFAHGQWSPVTQQEPLENILQGFLRPVRAGKSAIGRAAAQMARERSRDPDRSDGP